MPKNLNEPVVIEKAADVPEYVESIRSRLVDIEVASKGNVSEEVFARAASDLAAVKVGYDKLEVELAEVRNLAKMNASTVPGHKLLEDPTLRSFPRGGRSGSKSELIPDMELSSKYEGDTQRAFFEFLSADPRKVRVSLSEDAFKAYEKARAIHDTLSIVHAGMNAVFGENHAARAEWYARGGLKNTRLWKAWEDVALPFQRAMATGTAGAGLEWTPTGYASTPIDDIRNPISVTGQFEMINMPQPTYVYPVRGLPTKSYRIAQAGTIQQRNVSTLNLTLIAEKHAAMLITSTELDEDSLVDISSAIREELVYGLQYGLADNLMSGQRTATIDTASAPATTDVRYSSDGLRYFMNSIAASTRVNLGGSVSADVLSQMKGLQGRFGNRPDWMFWLTGFVFYAKLLTLRDSSGWAVVLTQDKRGAANTFDTGLLGKVFGSDVVVEQDWPENQDANGLITNLGNTLTSIGCVNRRGFRLGVRRAVQIEASRDFRFDTDEIAWRGTMRTSFKPIQTPSSVYRFVSQGVNMPTV